MKQKAKKRKKQREGEREGSKETKKEKNEKRKGKNKKKRKEKNKQKAERKGSEKKREGMNSKQTFVFSSCRWYEKGVLGLQFETDFCGPIWPDKKNCEIAKKEEKKEKNRGLNHPGKNRNISSQKHTFFLLTGNSNKE